MRTTNTISPAEFAALSTAQQLRRVMRLAQGALPLYGLPLDSEIVLLNYSENATFQIRPPGERPLVLRINRPGYQTRSSIASELEWVRALCRDTPVKTAEPIAGVDGDLVQNVSHPSVPESRNCVMMTFLPGSEPDEGNRTAAFTLLGETTARLHLHAALWKPATAVSRHRWDFDAMLGPRPLWGKWQDGLGMTLGKKRFLSRLVAALRPKIDALGESRSRFGLIHADLRAANVLVHQGEVAVIDFDDCGFSWYIYDLAAALSFLETHADVPSYIDAWLTSYQKIRSLSRAEIAAIDSLIMLRRMLLVAWIGSHADTAHAQAMGPSFTDDTCHLAENYLSRHS